MGLTVKLFIGSISCKSLVFFVITLLFYPLISSAEAILPDKTENIYYAYAISSNNWKGSRNSPDIPEYLRIAKECKKVGNVVCEAAALYNIGTILFTNEYYEDAIPYYRDALEMFESYNDTENIKLVLYNLIAAMLKNYSFSRDSVIIGLDNAQLYAKRLIELSKKTDDIENELAGYNFLGIINVYTRNYYIALENYEKILDYFVSNGIVEGKGNIFNNIAAIYYYLGDYKNALKYLQSAVVVYMINDKKAKVKDIRNNIAIIYAETGDIETAQIKLANLKIIAESDSDDCNLFNSLGVIYSELCEFEKALKYYNKSLNQAKNNHMEIEVAKNLKDIGRVYAVIGEYDNAMNYYKRSLAMSNNFNDYSNIIALNLSIGNVYAKEKLYSVALIHFEIALSMSRELEDRKMEAYSLFNVGNIYSYKREYKKSLEYYYESFNLYRGLGIKKGQGLSLVNISNTHNKLKNFKKGRKFAKNAISIFEKIDYYKHLKGAYLALADAYKGSNDLVNAEIYMSKASEFDIFCGTEEL